MADEPLKTGINDQDEGKSTDVSQDEKEGLALAAYLTI